MFTFIFQKRKLMFREFTPLSQGGDPGCNLVDRYQRPCPVHGTTLALGSGMDRGPGR